MQIFFWNEIYINPKNVHSAQGQIKALTYITPFLSQKSQCISIVRK